MSVQTSFSVAGSQARKIFHPSIKILSLSGVPAAGKNLSGRMIQEEFPEVEMMRSVTTRSRRSNDQDHEYLFESCAEFEERKRRGEFLWTEEKYGNRYGTLRKDVDDALGRNYPSMMHIVHETVPKLHRYVENEVGRPAVVFILLTCFDVDILRLRLTKRSEKPDLDESEKARQAKETEERVSDALLHQRNFLESGLYHYHIQNDGTYDTLELKAMLMDAVSKPIPKRRSFRMSV